MNQVDVRTRALRRFQTVEIGRDLPHIFYLARSVNEFRSLGGQSDQNAPGLRSLRCVANSIDRQTGVIDMTVLLDMKGRRGKAVRAVPFKDPVGDWPAFAGDPGGSWHFITNV